MRFIFFDHGSWILDKNERYDSGTSIAIGTNADKPIDIHSTIFDLDSSSNIKIDNTDANKSIF